MYYFTVEYQNGNKYYEGFSSENEARTIMQQRIEWCRKTNDTYGAEHTVYVGTQVPFSYKEREIAAQEKRVSMPALQGGEKQIQWAREIRYRFMQYLYHRYSDEEAAGRYHKEEEKSQCTASWWIKERYGFTITNKESMYVAEGKGNIWGM